MQRGRWEVLDDSITSPTSSQEIIEDKWDFGDMGSTRMQRVDVTAVRWSEPICHKVRLVFQNLNFVFGRQVFLFFKVSEGKKWMQGEHPDKKEPRTPTWIHADDTRSLDFPGVGSVLRVQQEAVLRWTSQVLERARRTWKLAGGASSRTDTWLGMPGDISSLCNITEGLIPESHVRSCSFWTKQQVKKKKKNIYWGFANRVNRETIILFCNSGKDDNMTFGCSGKKTDDFRLTSDNIEPKAARCFTVTGVFGTPRAWLSCLHIPRCANREKKNQTAAARQPNTILMLKL